MLNVCFGVKYGIDNAILAVRLWPRADRGSRLGKSPYLGSYSHQPQKKPPATASGFVILIPVRASQLSISNV